MEPSWGKISGYCVFPTRSVELGTIKAYCFRLQCSLLTCCERSLKSLPLIHEMKWNALSNNRKKKCMYIWQSDLSTINDRQAINLRSHGTGKEREREREKIFLQMTRNFWRHRMIIFRFYWRLGLQEENCKRKLSAKLDRVLYWRGLKPCWFNYVKITRNLINRMFVKQNMIGFCLTTIALYEDVIEPRDLTAMFGRLKPRKKVNKRKWAKLAPCVYGLSLPFCCQSK